MPCFSKPVLKHDRAVRSRCRARREAFAQLQAGDGAANELGERGLADSIGSRRRSQPQSEN
jgi:hypothetical protein